MLKHEKHLFISNKITIFAASNLKTITMNIYNDTKIKIVFDPDNTYTNKVVEVQNLLDDYMETVDDETTEFILTSTTETALNFVADAWGLKYEFC